MMALWLDWSISRKSRVVRKPVKPTQTLEVTLETAWTFRFSPLSMRSNSISHFAPICICKGAIIDRPSRATSIVRASIKPVSRRFTWIFLCKILRLATGRVTADLSSAFAVAISAWFILLFNNCDAVYARLFSVSLIGGCDAVITSVATCSRFASDPGCVMPASYRYTRISIRV